ncbi:MAG: pseudouridine synthase [Verrucomicrobia bacterium]|nr:pseudouridine synthase [Verrucomicrobiota bacterium]
MKTFDESIGVRLQKFLASAGLGSRRACEQLIVAGRVRVNGRVAALGARVTPEADRITLNGRPLSTQRLAYAALYKPVGYTCSNRDRHAEKLAIDLLPKDWPRVFSIGRLDRDSEGLLLITNDGELAQRLAHPRHKIPKTYEVTIRGSLTAAEMERLHKGMTISGERMVADKVFGVRNAGENTTFQMVLSQGKKRQIRLMLAELGHEVTRLKRLSIGPITLGELKPGKWRLLNDQELAKLSRVG